MYNLFKPYQRNVIKYNFGTQCHTKKCKVPKKNLLYKKITIYATYSTLLHTLRKSTASSPVWICHPANLLFKVCRWVLLSAKHAWGKADNFHLVHRLTTH